MKQTILTSSQSQLLEKLIVKYGQIVKFEQIIELTGDKWSYQYTKNILGKMVSNGWLVRIKKGIYQITDISSRGFLSISPYVVANLLENDSYVSFESALHFAGLLDQYTNKIVSLSLNSHKTVNINNIEYCFVKTKATLYFGFHERLIDNKTTHIAHPEKALIDIINFHKSKYAIDMVIEILQDHKTSLDIALLNQFLCKFSPTTIKIFGLIYDLLNIDSTQLHKLIKNNKSTHWMTPKDQKYNSKWKMYYDPFFDKYQNYHD